MVIKSMMLLAIPRLTFIKLENKMNMWFSQVEDVRQIVLSMFTS